MQQRGRSAMARFGAIVLALAAVFLLAYYGAIVVQLNYTEQDSASIFVDFVAFWAAAKLVLAGAPLAVFDIDALTAAQQLGPEIERRLYWFYPPHWLLAMTPFGALPFSAGLVLFSGLSAAAFVLALRGERRLPHGLGALTLAAPAMVLTLMIGNTAVLLAALLVAALRAESQGRAMRAGLLIACMTVKPSIGILIPIALVAGRAWATILWAALGSVALVALGTLAFGVEYWPRFFAQLQFALDLVAEGKLGLVRMTTWFAWLRGIGVTHADALTVQYVVSGGLATTVALVWALRGLAVELKYATLALAMPLATPYGHYYEMVFALVALLFLSRAGALTGLPGRVVAVLIWIGPLPGVLPQIPIATTAYGAPLLTLGLVYTLAQIIARHRLAEGA